MASHGDGGRESTSFEGARGIQAFVLDEDVGILAAAKQGRETLTERDGRSLGKDGIVTPHGGSKREQRGGRESFLDGGKIVAGVEDSGVLGANGLGAVGGVMLVTTGAFEMSWRRHGESLAGAADYACGNCEYRF